MSKRNKFQKIRKWLEHDINNRVKRKTSQDLFDWLMLAIWAVVTLLIALFSEDDLLNNLILWFTAYAVIRYTKETYWLKVIAQKDLESNKVSQKNEFMPILTFSGEGSIIQGRNLNIKLTNIGKGLARNITIWVEGHKITDGFDMAPDINNYSPGVSPEISDAINALTAEEGRTELNMSIDYYDIFERHFKLTGVKFLKDDDISGNRYVLQRFTGKSKFPF
ncbi:MAG: hypothetical protein U5L95_01195 [Candidatus Saccharibacteria bacterium]|nr:hypothetical protein [Candidatus Saccharibacteria bacterium]